MSDSHKVFEEIFNDVVHALAQVATYTSDDLKPVLNENLGTLMLWRGGFQREDLTKILDASTDITLAILRNLYTIGGCILRLSKFGRSSYACFFMLMQRRTSTKEHIRLLVSERAHEVSSVEDEDKDAFSDDSDNEMETNVDSLKLHVKHLMRLTPTMERVLADVVCLKRSIAVKSSPHTASERESPSQQVSRQRPPSYVHSTEDPTTKDSKTITNSPVGIPNTAEQALTKIVTPVPPQTRPEQNFYKLMSVLATTPLKYENPGLLDEALATVPLDSIYESAEEEYNVLKAIAESIEQGCQPEWGYQDTVVRALLRWFKQQFFSFVNNPVCSSCGHPTIANGIGPPTDDETARGAAKVEIYNCSECGSLERFPRYSDVWTLLETRKGRTGEFANCFTMLCRAAGCRARWVWSSEDLVWTEVYSDHQRRWIHVDAAEELWDQPKFYTEDWGLKLAYCIAFSSEGATDVTRRYVRNVNSQLPRSRVPETVLHWIMLKLRRARREDKDKEAQFRLMREDEIEERELSAFAAQSGVAAILQSLSLEGLTEDSTVILTKADSTSGEKQQTTSSEDTRLEINRRSVTDS